MVSSSEPVHCRRVTSSEVGRSWFQRYVWERTLSDPVLVRRQLIYAGIDRALRAEWRRRWSRSETGRALREAFPRVGTVWTTLDVAKGSRLPTLIAARFLVGYCRVGAFSVLWDPDECVACPSCGDDFPRDHSVCSCSGLSWERVALLRGVGPD